MASLLQGHRRALRMASLLFADLWRLWFLFNLFLPNNNVVTAEYTSSTKVVRRIAASRTAEGEERLHDEWLHRHPGPVRSVQVTRTPGTVEGEVEILDSAPGEMESKAMFNAK